MTLRPGGTRLHRVGASDKSVRAGGECISTRPRQSVLRSSARRSSVERPSCGAPPGPLIAVSPSSTISRGSAWRYCSLCIPPLGSSGRLRTVGSPCSRAAVASSSPRSLFSKRPSTRTVYPAVATLNRPAHSSSGLGRRPLTAVARVRIPYAPLLPSLDGRILRAAEVVPQGFWTAYGEIGLAATGRPNAARAVARLASRSGAFPNAWRVIHADGSIPDGWGHGGGGPQRCRELLESEGVTFSNGRADPAKKILADEIELLLAEG
jgi:alkylated DNA nucleotide flippase Atl1